MPPAEPPFRVLGVSGSLRRRSLNTALISAAAKCAPDGLELTLAPEALRLPLFDEDLEAQGQPESVQRLCALLAEADAVLVATPEYNQSLPGVLKNALDWVSRARPHPLDRKPIAILGVTSGPWGTRLAQAALRHTLSATGALVMPTPQFYLSEGTAAFQDGVLLEADVLGRLARFMSAFGRWIPLAAHRESI